ncbi:MAG: hypothetical protein QOG53_1585 [Frankiales bacterium]|nr:hypothetical protein [Frankiales bacterium]
MVLPPFQSLIDAHAGEVSRLCHALAGPNDGADCAQATWLAALRAYPTLKSATNLRGWLLTIAARAAIDQHRARNRRAIPVETVPERAVAEHHQHGDEIWAVVRTLPERQRHAIGLRYVLDLPHAEVARSLGVSPAMSRRIVSDALATLRNQWSQK